MSIHKFAKTLLLLTFVSPMVLASPGGHKHPQNHAGNGNHKLHYAKVLFVKPIYRNVRIERPQLYCDNRNVNHSGVTVVHQHSPDQIVLGGIMGGIIGHGLSDADTRGINTLAGVLIGSAVAHDLSSTQYVADSRWQQPQPRCREHIRVFERQELVGYKVKYKYQGQIFTTRSDQHPGSRILIQQAPAPHKSFVY